MGKGTQDQGGEVEAQPAGPPFPSHEAINQKLELEEMAPSGATPTPGGL